MKQMTTKNIYEEALADAKSLKEVAENNAKHAVINAVLPRIREMIETSLLEADDQDDDVLNDDVVDEDNVAGAISPPDAEGKVTLDIDAMTDEGALETNLEGKQALDKVVESRKSATYSPAAIKELCESTDTLAGAGQLISATLGYSNQILRTISRVQDMYGCLQEAIDIAPDKKKEHEEVLEGCHRKLQELKMTKKNKKMNEADVTLKLTGLPDDVDLDSMGVDLISDEEGEEGSEGGEASVGADGDHGDELDLGDLGGDEGDHDMGESLSHLSDDTVVEIDENMLRKEIARMKSLREDAGDPVGVNHPLKGGKDWDDETLEYSFGGKGPDSDILDVDDVEIQTAEDQDDMVYEADDVEEDMDEAEDMDESNRQHESLRRRFGFEKRLQERLRNRIRATRKAALKVEGKRATQLIRSHRALMARLTESVKRTNKIKRIVESTKRQTGASNGTRKSVGTESVLRAKLAEANLFNAKLSYSNKILQNDQLTSRQKARVIEQFDAAKNVAEAKLVYESLTKLLARKPVTESVGRKVIGSASRAARPTGAQQVVTEGFEVERWGKLAGIK
jgi:hypothetical protein